MQTGSQPWSVRVLRIEVGAGTRVFWGANLFLVYADERLGFRVLHDGVEVANYIIKLEDVDFLISAAARKSVEVRYRDEFRAPVRIRLATSEDGQKLVDFIQSIGSTELQRPVEEALSSIENNPRTGYLGAPWCPYVGPLPSPPANEGGESSREA
ncbi:MAG: hypothetical protein Q9192_002093 [Flavoplaca navasiana]